MMTNVVGSQFDKVTQYYLVYQECHIATLVENHTNYQYHPAARLHGHYQPIIVNKSDPQLLSIFTTQATKDVERHIANQLELLDTHNYR